jgi:hypothetical protein
VADVGFVAAAELAAPGAAFVAVAVLGAAAGASAPHAAQAIRADATAHAQIVALVPLDRRGFLCCLT